MVNEAPLDRPGKGDTGTPNGGLPSGAGDGPVAEPVTNAAPADAETADEAVDAPAGDADEGAPV